MTPNAPTLWEISTWGTPEEQDVRQSIRDAIFDKIAPKGSWKMPIDAWIDPVDFYDCNKACGWFTGGTLTVVATFGVMLNVQSGGYYVNIGA